MDRDIVRRRLLKYTRRAFRMLPKLDRPRILDIGCGSGVPTMELARLGQGEVTGIDIDQSALDKLTRKIQEAGLSDRVRAANCSILDMAFPDESFDIVWSEGSIFVIGFKRGIQQWKRFLKPGGFMVIHDERGNVEEKLEQISKCGYKLLGYFILSEETWRIEYFAPLQKLIAESQTSPADDPHTLEELSQARRELEMFRRSLEHNSSVYFVMQKNRQQETRRAGRAAVVSLLLTNGRS
jgi:ubiquinone/menaquinone biosynthesis C-methylase UbiE